MDSQIFLGGTEQTTLKDLNTTLGKETIDLYNTGETRGMSPSYNMNYQKLAHDLMSIDELAVMDGGKCIVQLRGVRPFLSNKFDLTKHPNYPLTSDYSKKNWFDVEKFLKQKLVLKADDRYEVIEVNEQKALVFVPIKDTLAESFYIAQKWAESARKSVTTAEVLALTVNNGIREEP